MPSYIIGLDGSALAEATLLYATTLARAHGARLVLVQAVPEEEDAALDGPLPAFPNDPDGFQWGPSGAAMAGAYDYLIGLAQHLRESNLEVHVVVKIGDPADVLIEESREQGADLIILGTHGRSGVSRLLYGSVAETVLNRSPVPLLLVPARSIDRIHGGLPRTLIVPLDGSAYAEAALPKALDLARAFDARIRLVRAISLSSAILLAETAAIPSVSSPDILATEAVVAEKYLQRLVERVRIHDVAASYSISFDQPGPAIRRIADGLPGSIIVMATHARGGVSRVLLGSVAVDVVRHGTVPVAFVRPTEVVLEEHAATTGAATNALIH